MLQCWHWQEAFFGWLVLKLFSLSTVRTSIFVLSINFNIGILDKIFCASCCVLRSIYNSSTEEISSLISTSVLLKFLYFLSNFISISALGLNFCYNKSWYYGCTKARWSKHGMIQQNILSRSSLLFKKIRCFNWFM